MQLYFSRFLPKLLAKESVAFQSEKIFDYSSVVKHSSTLDPYCRQQREAWNPLAHHQWMSRLLRAPEEFAIKTIHPVPNAPFTKREPSIQKVKGYDKQGMLYACRTTSLQSWCLRLIQMAQKGVQYKDHDRRTRWSMWGDQGWRAAAESQVNRDVLFADYEIKKN